MTQLELDALMNAENLDEIIQEEPQKDMDECDIVHQLSSVTVDSEKKATEIMAQLDQVLNELDALGTCINENQSDKALVIVEDLKNVIFDTMSMMQYQDIHRQKIERVINTMVKISSMMNDTLQDVVNIAPSAKHIDDEDGAVVDDAELEQLIAAMGNK
jgi:hypothetical protein